MTAPLAEINKQLGQHTIVSKLHFDSDLSTGCCEMIIRLTDDDALPTSVLVLELHQVAGVMISRFGGGVTQVIGLRLRDASEDQQDRVTYELLDLEDAKLSLRCRSFTSQIERSDGPI